MDKDKENEKERGGCSQFLEVVTTIQFQRGRIEIEERRRRRRGLAIPVVRHGFL